MYEKAKKGFKLPTKRVVVFISDVVHDEFTTYCEEHDYIRPRLIELILEEFLERYGVKPVDKNGSPGE
jgi:hypothetical protein